MIDDPGDLRFFRVEEHLAGKVLAFSPPDDEMEDTPSVIK